MKRFLFLCLLPLSLQCFGANAYDAKIDGIYYKFSGRNAYVYFQYEGGANSSAYSGSKTIPSTVTYNNLVYSVTSIYHSAFDYCSNLTAVTIPSSVTSIGYNAFRYCSSLTEITIPNSVTSIGYDAFQGCTSLKSVTLSESITSIESNTFDSCIALDSITLPASLTSISASAFAYCTNLTCVTSLNPEPPTCASTAFNGVDVSACTLLVPKGSLEAYAAADVWKEFFGIIEIEDETTDGDESDSSDVDGDDNSGDGSDVSGDTSGDNSGDGSDVSGDTSGDNSGDGSDVSGDTSGDGSETDGINGVAADANVGAYYTLDGKEVTAPAKGVNIVKYSDGTTKKVLVK